MARNRKGKSLFDLEDTEQQVLPFDFSDTDDEKKPEKGKKSFVKDSSPLLPGLDEQEESVESAPADVEVPDEELNEEEEAAQPEDSPVEEEEAPEEVPVSAEDKPDTFGEEEDDDEVPESTEDRPETATPPVQGKDDAEPVESSVAEATIGAEAQPEVEKPTEGPSVKDEQPVKNIDNENLKPKHTSTPMKNPREHKIMVTAAHSEVNIGQILQEARVRKNLSIDQVAQSTKIKRDFIQALEDGDNSVLPTRVFVDAYIKTLAETYGVSVSEILQNSHRPPRDKKVPTEILNSIEKGKQVNLEEETKLKNLLKIALMALATLVVLVLIVVKVRQMSGRKAAALPPAPVPVAEDVVQPEPPKKVTSEDMEKFIPPTRAFNMTELPLPSKAPQAGEGTE